MHIAFREHLIEVSRWDSREQMVRYLRTDCAAGNILLGEDAELAVEFYTATLYLGSKETRFGIGICSEGYGLTPQMLLLLESDMLMFGFNREVVAFSIVDMKVQFTVDLVAPFYRFLTIPGRSVILVLYEIGVIALSCDGRYLWQYDKDIITDYRIADDQLIIEMMDSPTVAIDLSTGTISPISA